MDGGPCPGGLESTVLSLTGETPLLLRPGLVTRVPIEEIIGPVQTAAPASAGTSPGAPLESPGMLAAHYAPRARLRLDADDALEQGEALLAFGDAPEDGPAGPAGYTAVRNLSPAGDLVEAAANLFRLLHELDALDPTSIAVAPIPDDGLGAAINDRLRARRIGREADFPAKCRKSAPTYETTYETTRPLPLRFPCEKPPCTP